MNSTTTISHFDMDQASSRIPAWRKLGLKLDHHSQSGDAEATLNGTQGGENQPGGDSGEAIAKLRVELSPRPTGNPISSTLGKRKSLDGPAERQSPKKSRKIEKQNKVDETTRDPPVDIAAVAKDKNAGSDASRPKGDSNYRQKKKGQIKSRSPTIASSPSQGNRESKRTTRKEPREPTHKQSLVHSLSPTETDSTNEGLTLLVSTETEVPEPPSFFTPPKSKKSNTPANTTQEGSPPTGRRKSVAFTPDTKTADGNSASNLFKKWVVEQKTAGADSDFSPAAVAQFTPPPKVHPANTVAAPLASGESPNPGSGKGKKKDPSVYLAYLSQYHTNRSLWKFNKAKQNDVLDNALNIFRIPEQYTDALLEYIRGLKGEGVVGRLEKTWNQALHELSLAEAQSDPEDMSTMDDPKVRKAAQEEALQERLTKEKKRRRLEGDIEGLDGHPYPEGYIRRLKRRRAEALLSALNIRIPSQPSTVTSAATSGISRKPLQLKKSRTGNGENADSSDGSSDSSSSSSEDPSSSESESEENGDNSSSGSSSSSGSEESSADDGSGSGEENKTSTSSDAGSSSGEEESEDSESE
ncbi:hypothetical protein BDV95DRAFT_572424 [Massariosphaeria phaeospora]|uniref:WKF domain-containing protein n=1 Tax=Massariosphaeria phaeospora TaxID=100035 RepID=A0A7C8M5Z6_9PLEO|nr:hypothetical protein BDV95DRAFT_572424 [Massariosphaeria phaeospora]